MALAPISRLEIRIWEADEGVRLDPWERRAILRLDAEFRTAHAPRDSKGNNGGNQAPPVEEF